MTSPNCLLGAGLVHRPVLPEPRRKSLLTLFGAEHSLGGIPGYSVAETTDESPERVALIQQITLAYLRNELGLDDSSWQATRAALEESDIQLGRIESK